MGNAYVRLDPTLPVCWENTETLRIGFDSAVARLQGPSASEQHFIGLLRSGVPARDLNRIARKTGLNTIQRETLLAAVGPALIRTTVPRLPHERKEADPQIEVAILGHGSLVRRMRHCLEQSGFVVTAAHAQADFAVVIEQFWGSADAAQELLAAAIPHVPVRFTDRSFTVGPVVLPGGAPCLSCVDLRAFEEDPLLASIAIQLLGEPPGAATPASVAHAASTATTFIRRTLDGSSEFTSERLRFSVQIGTPDVSPSVDRVLPHPACACVSLAEAA